MNNAIKNAIPRKFYIPALAILCLIVLSFLEPVAQNNSYHQFADSRIFFNVPNFLNVISNLPFAIVAFLGFKYTINMDDSRLKITSLAVLIGFFLVSLGSGYYHLSPGNETLLYDRIPIVIILMSFFAYVIATHICSKAGITALFLFNFLGILSVIYWSWTEKNGNGDIRWYGFVQFFPVIAIPLFLWLYKSPATFWKKVVPVFVFFGLAKLVEKYDSEIYGLLGETVSGHSLKHLLMSAAGFRIIGLYRVVIKKEYIKRKW